MSAVSRARASLGETSLQELAQPTFVRAHVDLLVPQHPLGEAHGGHHEDDLRRERDRDLWQVVGAHDRLANHHDHVHDRNRRHPEQANVKFNNRDRHQLNLNTKDNHEFYLIGVCP